MKKNVLILSALCFAAMTLVFSGCKKETNDPQEPAKVQTYQMSIQASKGADNQANGSRRVIGLGTDGETLTATWQTGDVVTVLNSTKSYQQLEGVLRAQSNGVNTLLTGTLSGTVEVDDELLLRYKSKSNPYYKNQNGTLDHISANCDYATAMVTVAAVNDGVITTTTNATFANEQAIVKFTLKNEANDAALNATELVVKVGDEDTYTVTPESATNEMYVAISLEPYPQPVTLTATAADGTYTKAVTSEDAALENGKFYRITVSMAKETPAVPAGALTGAFTVDGSGTKVNFAKGNLRFTRTSTSVDWSTGTFSFMDNQYDYIETTNVSGDYANETAIGLFGWATSNINTPANTYYYPWETDNSDGANAKYGSGITTAVNWSDNGNEFANYDWGKNMGTGWRTLTKDEWVYLFDTRTVNGGIGNGNSYTLGQSVNGTPGIVLYPDNYTGAAYTGSNWSTFEDAGCVFLPVAGYRSGTSVSYVGSYGRYWSSTSESGISAYDVYFGESSVDLADYDNRDNGCSVRLVKNVE